jgi:hypothetical protein
MKYGVTFTVQVTNPELLLERAREMDAEPTEIENELTAAARRARGDTQDYEPEGVDSIEEALCRGCPAAMTMRIVSTYSTPRRWPSARPPDHDRRMPLQISASPAPIGSQKSPLTSAFSDAVGSAPRLFSR